MKEGRERERARQRGRRECIVDWGKRGRRSTVALNQNSVRIKTQQI